KLWRHARQPEKRARGDAPPAPPGEDGVHRTEKRAWSLRCRGSEAHELQEFLAQLGIGQERAAHDTIGHMRFILDAAPVGAEMIGFQYEPERMRSDARLQQIGQLDYSLLLDLRTAHDPLCNAGKLRQPDQIRLLTG